MSRVLQKIRQLSRRTSAVVLRGRDGPSASRLHVRTMPFRWLRAVSWIDIKLGLRRLVKHRGLTLAGGLAMATAMTMSAVVFSVIDMAQPTSIPLDEGDRVVALQAWDARARARLTTPMDDFLRWREELRLVENVGAFQTIERNLVVDGIAPEPVSIAEITASGFDLTRVPPLLGRVLLPSDELPGAQPVVVIGFDAWRSRFGSDPDVVGRDVRFGRTVHEVVGVMPEGFGFPVNHTFWIPLRRDEHPAVATVDGRGAVFARLAVGTTLAQADAELSAVGLASVLSNEAEGSRSTRVVPYAFAFSDEMDFAASLVWLLGVLLLVPPCANIAILIYARTVVRRDEFVARHALGASRGRIVGQLFVETLCLAGLAAVASLVMVQFVHDALLGFLREELAGGLPFWFQPTPSIETVLFLTSLALVAALIAGLIPALQATGRMMRSGIGSLGSRTGPQLGRTWTVLVAAQVALVIAAIPSATEMAWGTLRPGVLGPGFSAQEFLTARLELDSEPAGPADAVDGVSQAALAARLGVVQAELIQRLSTEPGFLAATLASSVPGEGPWRLVEVERSGQTERIRSDELGISRYTQVTYVTPGFFETFAMDLRIGRLLEPGDASGDGSAAVVSVAFARQILGIDNPIGRRFRYAGEGTSGTQPDWYEIVGVVADIPANELGGRAYHPVAAGELYPATLAVHTRPGTPAMTAERLREVAAAVDPTLRLGALTPLDAIYRRQALGNTLGALALGAGTLSVLLLSAVGMYALMSFTVNQRRREIGIRAALGARPRRLLAGILGTAARQLAIGAMIGGLVALAIDIYVPEEILQAVGGWTVPGILPATGVLVLLVGLLATLGPARRGLRVHPAEAIRGAG